jgi:hypothetical protein
MPSNIGAGDSVACSAWDERGRPRKVTPKALTKQAAASPPVSASMEAAKAAASPEAPPSRTPPRSSAWNVSHSETKPLSGGRPEIAAARGNSQAVRACARQPPSSSMLRWWVRLSTLPAPRNKSPLKAAWLMVWKSAAARASVASASAPLPRLSSSMASPRPIRMMPTFSTL